MNEPDPHCHLNTEANCGSAILNLQPRGSLAKPYRVDQVRKVIPQDKLVATTEVTEYEIILYWSGEDEVGRSGSGKTTIVKLLHRLYDIGEGRISIDGQDIAGVTQVSLRTQLALVPQEPILFHRSLAENIAYGRTHACARSRPPRLWRTHTSSSAGSRKGTQPWLASGV